MTSLRTRHFLAPLAFFLAILLAACGGGSSSSSPTLSGTAATGAALAGDTVTVVDAVGTTRTATTDANGNYSLDVSGLTAPFLIKVVDGVKGTFYSVGNAAGIANIHPLTDLIVKTWYQVQGTTAAAAFAAPATNPPPTVTELKVITEVVVHVVQTWLVSAGLDPAAFNIFTTPFTAGSGTGFDGFLDTLAVNTTNMTAPVITVTSGANGQTSNVTVAGTGDISVNTTITINGVTGTTLTTAFVPSTAAASAALTGILTSLSGMADVVNTKGMSLAGSDLVPYFDAGYLDFGLNQAQGASWLAQDLQGVTLNSFVVDSILGFDSVNNFMTIIGRATVSANGVTAVQYANGDGHGMTFKKQGNGSWLFYGDQQKTKATVQVSSETRLTGPSCGGCSTTVQLLEVQVMSPQGTISATPATSTVQGLFNGSSTTVNLKNDNTTTEKGIAFDQFNADDAGGSFYVLTSAANVPPAGSSYNFSISLAAGGTETYSVKLGAATQETISIQSVTLQSNPATNVGHSWSAVKDVPILLTWNLPTTFAIADVQVYAHVSTASNGSCDIQLPAGEILNTTSTSAHITLPSTCNGFPVVNNPGMPSVSVVVKGINGEQVDSWWAFNET